MTLFSRRQALKLGGLAGSLLLGPGRLLRQGSGAAARQARPDQASPFLATEILSRPTDRSVTLSVVPEVDLELYVEHGPAADRYERQTAPQLLRGGVPAGLLVDGLAADSPVHYRLRYRQGSAGAFLAGPARRFHTQRAPGQSFVFAVQADSHLGTAKHCDPALYTRTLQHIAAYQPDLLIDLGDTFRATKLKEPSRQAITRLYQNQREYLGLAAHSSPLFLVNGNHEMEWGWLLDASAESVPVLSALARKAWYPQPEPDAFYSGNEEALPQIGLPQDYYAWHWGDALFVVIDPYWHTPVDPGGAGVDKVTGDDSPKDPWAWTLGEAQYRWFKRTLEDSGARYKFVFHHHVLGACRGGIEWADYYEWGGRERNGADSFARHRPGWELPIHPLMVKHGVTLFFQGHDHVFVRQERDGIVYQTLPMAADPTYSAYNSDAFHSGVILPNAGHLRVAVAPDGVTVDYIRSVLPQDENEERRDGTVAHSYRLPASGAPPLTQPPPTRAATAAPPASPTAPVPTATATTAAPSPTPAARELYLPRLGGGHP